MKVIAIAQHPSVLSQITTTVSLAGALAADGFSVLIIETNAEATASTYFTNKTDPEHVLADIFKAPENTQSFDASSLICDSGVANISLVLAGDDLSENIAAKAGMGLVVHKLLSTLNMAYEYVLIISPRSVNVLMVNAIAASHVLVIPVVSTKESPDSITTLLDVTKMIETSKASSLSKLIIPIEHDQQAEGAEDSLSVWKEQFDEYMWDGFIPLDPNFRAAAEKHVPITELNPTTPGAIAYRRLLSRFY